MSDMPATDPIETVETEPVISTEADDFERLHPLTIVLKTVAAASQNLIAMGVLYFSVFDRNIIYTLLAAISLMAVITGISALVWSRFTYHVGPTEIRIKSGLFQRNNRSIPFDRIQDVSLEQKLVSRLLGLATVKLETGASAGEDGKLDALALNDAQALRDLLRDYKSGLVAGSGTATGIAAEKTVIPPLFAMDSRRIFIAGLFNFSFVLLAILGAIAQNLDFLIPSEYFDPWYWADRFSEREVIHSIGLTAQIAGAVGALFSLIFIGVGSGLVRTFVREHGFRLDRVDTGQPGFRRRRGLLTLTDMVMPIHRVQAAIIATGPVREYFGWYHLKLQSLAGDPSGETDHSAAPCARPEEFAPILSETNIAGPTDEILFQSVNAAFWWRDAVIMFLILMTVAIIGGLHVHPGVFAAMLLAVPAIAIMYLNWRRHRFVLSGNQLFVRRGWWRRRLTILPIRKIQTADISQSPLDHPLDLATLTLGVAGGTSLAPLRISAIPLNQAHALRAQLI
ncbi:PH domain-containing protein [Parasphingorhabdus sp.]|uniref:PH domain-containing protein n=1 Tax=Parasphingorhabdus sp. TaxID=2709688 RepID=UPI003264C53D